MSEKHLIVGLGNPGKEYEYTRHNFGFLVVKHIAEQYQLKFSASSFTKGYTAKGTIDGKEVELFMPMTHMNNSGTAVKRFIEHEGLELNQMLVVTDDVNLKLGDIRIRPSGSDGGHNGLTSIIEHLNSDAFARLRLGIGWLPGKKDMVDFVLEEFSSKEKEELEGLILLAADCCVVWLKEGIEKTMNQFNRRKENG